MLDDETRKVLQVVDYAERTGSPLTVTEFTGFAEGPTRRSSYVGMAALTGGIRTNETVLQFIRRVRLIDEEAGGVRLTRLGRIILSGASEQEAAEKLAEDVVLAAGDPFATVDLLRAVRRAGSCLLVDPYCREPQLLDIVRYTETTRVLIGPDAARDDFALILGAVRPPREIELRVTSDVHDRHVIPEIGPVLTFGASLNRVGRGKPSILVQLTADLSSSVRATYEELWKGADPWKPPAKEAEPSQAQAGNDSPT